MDIVLDEAKVGLDTKSRLSLDELADLLSLVEVYPQPTSVLERLKAEFAYLSENNIRATALDPADVHPDRNARIAITDVIFQLRARKTEAVGEFMGRRSVEHPETYFAYLENVIQVRQKEEETQLDTYTTLARRLTVMKKFQMRLQTIRDRWGLPVLSWVKSMQVRWAASQDLIVSLIEGCSRPEDDLDRKLTAALRVACREVNLDPADGFGTATVLLAFNAQPEDLLSDSPHLKVIQHFIMQKAETMLSRVCVDSDDTGLLSGALVALAHLGAILPPDIQLPDSVIEWLDYARHLHDLLELNSDDLLDIDTAMEDVGGRLTNLKISEPSVYIAITSEMNQVDIKDAFKVAQSQVRHIHPLQKTSVRKWEKLSNYDDQISFYLLYREEYDKKPYEAVPRAIKRHNILRARQGLVKYFADENAIAQANEWIYLVETLQQQESL